MDARCIRIKKFADTKISGYVWTGPKCSLLPFRHDSFSRSLFTNFHFIFTHMDLISQFVSAILEPTLVSCLEMMPEMIILGASVLR